MCVKYRGPNAITTRDQYPLPYIEDLIDQLHCSRVFTKLDLASGYHQLCIHANDRHLRGLKLRKASMSGR